MTCKPKWAGCDWHFMLVGNNLRHSIYLSIGENVRLIDDILAASVKGNIEGFWVAIDFEKAFDKIDWSFIDKALKMFGFGIQFRNMVKSLYNDAMSCVSSPQNGGLII